MDVNINAYYRLARLDKPTGIWLLLLPCWFGLALSGTRELWLYPLFAFGAVVMRSAGCIINDIFDRKIDAQVERTKTRPLASGEVSLVEAITLVFLLLMLGLAILAILPSISIIIALLIMPLVVLYPLAKRITHYPQVVLGVVFNIGVLVAYSAATGTISFASVILYIGCIFWTLGYDTIYAIQDAVDDERIGVKSTAVRYLKQARVVVGGSYWAFVLLVTLGVFLHHEITLASLVFLILAKLHFSWQVYAVTHKNPQLCGQLFKANIYPGALIFLAILISYF